MAGQPTATLTEGATLSHVLGLKDGSTIRQSLADIAAQLLVSPELAALIGNYDLFQGEWDASGGVFPSGAAKGHFWRVSQAGAGTVDGISFAASDVLIALVDDASTEVYAGNWHKAAYTGISHEHAISAIVGLQAALDAKASAEQGEKADTAVQPGDLAGVATSGNSDDLSEGVAKLLMTASERSKLAGIEDGVFPVSDRPGDHPDAFSASYTGAGAGKDPLSGGTEVVGAGTAYVLTGAGTVAARYPVALNNDVVEFTARFRRTANPSDPNNHAVRLQVAWLDKSKSLIGSVQTLATKSDALTSSGLIELSTRVSSMAVEDVVTPPMGAVYACPFIQTYGEDGATAIETLRSLEVTDLHTIESADLSTLIAQTEAARDAAETAANVVATETLDTMADVASYDRAAGVGVISLKGGYARGDGLGGQWVYDPDGVEVTPDVPSLLIGNDGANYKMAAANLVYRTKPTIAALAAATDIAVGQTITVSRSHNGEKETFIALAPGTYTANGTTVVDGVSVQLVSTRMKFNTRAEALADTRPDAWFTAGNYGGIGGPSGWAVKKVASGEDYTNAGGAKFEVLPGVTGYNVKAFGARGVNFDQDDQPYVLAALQKGTAAGVKVYAPEGEYLLGFAGKQCELTGLTSDVVFEGAGRGTVFKRGDGIVTSSFTQVFVFENASGTSINATVRNLTIDGNARGNGLPYTLSSVTGTFVAGETINNGTDNFTVVDVDGTTLYIYETTTTDSPGGFDSLEVGDTITGGTSGATATIATDPGEYVYQQSHCLSFGPKGAKGINRLTVENVHFVDPTADGLNIGGNATNTVGDVILRGITQETRNRVRSDITVTACFDTMSISQCVVDKFEYELNAHTTSLAHKTTVNGLICRKSFDVTHGGTTALSHKDYPVFSASGLIVDGYLQLGGAHFSFADPTFRLSCSPRMYDGRYEFHGGRSFFGINGASFTPTKGWYSDGSASPEKVLFDDHTFDCHDDADATLSEYFSDLNAFNATAETFEFINCRFLNDAVKAATLRSGKFRFRGCEHNYAGASITYGDVNASGVTNELDLFDNIVTHASGLLVACPSGGNQLDIRMRGNVHKSQTSLITFNAARVMSPRGSGSVLNFVEVDDYQMSATPTSGDFLAGQRVYYLAPAAGASWGVQCTTTGTAGTSAVFKSLGNLAA